MNRKLVFISLALVMSFMAISLIFSPARAGVMGSKGRPVVSDGECKAIVFRFDKLGNVQIEELDRTVDQISHLDWLSEMQNGSHVTVYYRGGGKQNIRLHLPTSRLHQVGFSCGKDGLAKLLVTDCRTNKPINGVLVSENGGRYSKYPTNSKGQAMVACNCRPPQKDVVVLERGGYQTKKVNISFSGRKIDRWKTCLNKVGTVKPPPPSTAGNPFLGDWKGKTWCGQPEGSKSNFTFSVWLDRGVLKAWDHYQKNLFKTPKMIDEGHRWKLDCPWFRAKEDKGGVYYMYIDKNNSKAMYGVEYTKNIKCKKYLYQLNRHK